MWFGWFGINEFFSVLLYTGKQSDRTVIYVNNAINFGGKYIYNDDNLRTKYNAMCEKMIVDLIKDLIVIVNAIFFSYMTFGCD